jgi:hypothetical protein
MGSIDHGIVRLTLLERPGERVGASMNVSWPAERRHTLARSGEIQSGAGSRTAVDHLEVAAG